MRLGQIARKYNISQDKIIAFLNETAPGMGPFHNNSKLSDQAEDQIVSHFNILPEGFSEESSPSTEEPATEEQEVVEESSFIDQSITNEEHEVKKPEPGLSQSEKEVQEKLDPTLPPVKEPRIDPQDENAISTDKLLELLESEDENIDLSDIKIIKAPKKELKGLKVVGKIELEEPKPKPKTEVEDKTKEPEAKPTGRRDSRKSKNRQPLSEEEREKRRLAAKAKKEAYEARKKKRQEEKEIRRLKEKKRAHYEQRLNHSKTAQKPKPRKKTPEPVAEVQQPVEKPKTLWGKFRLWLKG